MSRDLILTNCRICTGTNLIDCINLGDQIITSRFPTYGDFSTPKTPLTLCMCQTCGLLQLRHTTNASELYEHEYGYRSGISNTMRAHLNAYQRDIIALAEPQDGDVIVDIGSNDSTMLQFYPDTLKRIGVDPTGKQFKEYYGKVDLIADYFTYNNFTKAYGNLKCKVVSSISMFYDLPNPVQFAKDIYDILDNDGIWTCEQSYVLAMLRTNSVDTICQEHLEYYALKQVKLIADMVGFKIVDVQFNDCNGGSFRIYLAKKSSTKHAENTSLINKILHDELEFGIMDINVYREFMTRCDKEVAKLRTFIDNIKKDNKTMYIYGASTKGNCLLQYAKIDESDVPYAVERNPKKIGKMTASGSRIIGEEEMRQAPPNFLLVLPWHFRKEITEREQSFLQSGGQLVFPFPHLDIVSYKPRALITGCDGFIASYVKERFSPDYTLYGIARDHLDNTNNTNNTSLTKFRIDMNDAKALEQVISIVRPEIIIHLAGISSSAYAFTHPIEALQTNGMMTAILCDIIHRSGRPTKLFNASSSEIYKGHIGYYVKDNDTHMYHLHPYSIAKAMSHSVIEFYRTVHNMPFSNGVIFTTESSRKNPVFLLNKVASHACQWSIVKKPLTLGNLDSSRNILHASDVANAIHTIMEKTSPADTYLICNNYTARVKDLVVIIYSKFGIVLEENADGFCDSNGEQVIIIKKESNNGYDSRAINITGEPTKLFALDWMPTISLNEILDEIVEHAHSSS